MIALLCPTRDREAQFARMRISARDTSRTGNVSVFGATNGGNSYADCLKFPDDCPTVYMWNSLANIVVSNKSIKLFMLASDDIIFSTPGWDEALLEHYEKLENKIHVYHLQDSRDVDGTPHPIVTREYINALGYFMHPIFLHWFVDSWTVALAKSNNCFTHLRDYELIHDKPSDRGEADETHNRIRRNGWHARDTEVNRTCQHILEWEKRRLALAMQ